ncbi:MAG TPA: 6-pyruvoyl-tetrahydropterin synthase-related protein [Myxococcales bacterium]|nr:6-pyruvoyl-tetrahydropterin synthase-related protein [Myxococcales bacterium]
MPGTEAQKPPRSFPAAAFLARLLRRREGLAAALACLALAAWMSHPLWGGVWFDAHEYSRYVLRSIEYLRDLRAGALFPRWAPDFYGGFGSPFFDFFPPGVFAATAPFAALGFSVTTALKLAMLAFTAAGALGAYEMVRRETGRPDAALVAGAAFAFAPYRFVDLLLRGDLAEYSALALVPWTILLYRELGRTSRERLPRTAFFAALCHAALLLTHTIIGQWATEAVFALVLLPAALDWLRGRRLRALAPFLALAGAFGLAAIYVWPALAEKGFAHFERVVGGYYVFSHHMVPAADYLKFDYYGFVGDFPPWQRMPFSVGRPLAFAAVVAVACLAWPRAWRTTLAGLPFWAGTAAFLYVMTPSAEWAYRWLPMAAYVQFPWRLLGLAAAFGAGAIGVTWAAALDGPLRPARWPLCLAAVALIVFDAQRFERVKAYYPADKVPQTVADVVAGGMDGTASADEHLPREASRPPAHPRDRLIVASPGVEARATQKSGTAYDVQVDATGPGAADLLVFDFPGWKARTIAGPAQATLGPSPQGLAQLTFPAAGHYEVAVSFGTTPVRTAAAALSLLTLLFLWPLLKALARWRVLAPRAAPEAAPAPPPAPSVQPSL